MKASEFRKLIREEVKAIVKEQHLHEKAEYFPAGLSKHLQRALLAALKDGTIRIVGADPRDFPDYAEDMAMELIAGKSLKDILNNILTEDVNLIATGDKDLKSIIEYLNSIGIKPVYPRFFTGTFTKNRQLDVDISRDSRPFTKEYVALQNNETKFRQILRKANVPDKPVLVCTYQDDFGSYVLGIYNTHLKETSAALTSSTKNFKSFIVK